MTVFRNDDRWDRSNALFASGQLLRYDKVNRTPDMKHIDYGLGVLTAASIEPVPLDRPIRPCQRLSAPARRGTNWLGCEVTDRFYEIGSPEGLAETRAFLATRSSME